MSEGLGVERASGAPTAGRLLREAREKQGLHIAALAASIKVTPKKLEMLEADRFEALPDATFTRALAQTVCRALKIDPTPVLGLLPPLGHRLDQVGAGLNAPFRDRPGALVQREGSALSFGPWFWITGLVALAAVGVFLIPPGTIRMPPWSANRAVPVAVGAGASEPQVVTSESGVLPGETITTSGPTQIVSSPIVGPAASVPAAPATSTVVPSMAVTSVPAAGTSMLPASGARVDGAIQVRASEATWVDITDARGHSLVSRLFQPGETAGVDGEAPFRLRIGNAGGTRVSFRGQPMELAAYTRDNVARFELK